MVLHRCDNPPCVNPDHLSLGTAADNAADRDAKGRSGTAGERNHNRQFPERVRGAKNPNAKLTNAVVAAIRARYRDGGISQQALGDEYGVTQVQVSRIVRGRAW
jgi:ribosome-binding protein aMBF1 (putative translation factor)